MDEIWLMYIFTITVVINVRILDIAFCLKRLCILYPNQAYFWNMNDMLLQTPCVIHADTECNIQEKQ